LRVAAAPRFTRVESSFGARRDHKTSLNQAVSTPVALSFHVYETLSHSTIQLSTTPGLRNSAQKPEIRHFWCDDAITRGQALEFDLDQVEKEFGVKASAAYKI